MKLRSFEGSSGTREWAQFTRKVMSMALAFLLAATLVPAMALSAFADDAEYQGIQEGMHMAAEELAEEFAQGGTDAAGLEASEEINKNTNTEVIDDLTETEDGSAVVDDEGMLSTKELLESQESINATEDSLQSAPLDSEDSTKLSEADAALELEALSTPVFTPTVTATTQAQLQGHINAATSSQLVIGITSSFTLASVITVPTGKNIVITSSSAYTLTTQGTFRHFHVSGQLTMAGNLTLTRRAANDATGSHGGIYVENGSFTMYSGSISGNLSNGALVGGDGGGVQVKNGSFNMHGGAIRNNIALYGGGVFISDSGQFNMHGGVISGNSLRHSTGQNAGGGVYLASRSAFNMHGGEIHSNISARRGAGVSVDGGSTFIMNSGAINNNNVTCIEGLDAQGGGVCVRGSSITGGTRFVSTFTMNGGVINKNTSVDNGGGVYVDGSGGDSFTMNGGMISNNTAAGNGGGIYMSQAERSVVTSSNANFTGNVAGRAFDYGIAKRGAAGQYPHLNWRGDNSLRGTHLLNNYDISYTSGAELKPPVITTTALPNGTVGVFYSFTLVATGAKPIQWINVADSNSSWNEAPGLGGITTFGGEIRGTPTVAGTYRYIIKAENPVSSVTKTFTLTIVDPPAKPKPTGTKPKITTGSSLHDGITGVAYKKTLAASGTKTIKWVRSSGSLPPGLKLSSAGVITGKPTKPGTFKFTVKATNSAGSATKTYTIKVNKPTISISYQTHVQTVGWQAFKKDGAMSGTSGKALRLEGIKINLQNNTGISGGISYSTHVQSIGWQKKVSFSTGGKSLKDVKGPMSGTSGRALRLEAITIELTGDLKKHYDIYYRVHAQKVGWMGWARNGEQAGTAGHAYRLEGIQIVLVPKVGGKKPGNTFKGITTPPNTKNFIKR